MLVVGGRSQRTYGVARAGGIPISLAVLVGPDGQAQAEGHEHDRRATPRHRTLKGGERRDRYSRAFTCSCGGTHNNIEGNQTTTTRRHLPGPVYSPRKTL